MYTISRRNVLRYGALAVFIMGGCSTGAYTMDGGDTVIPNAKYVGWGTAGQDGQHMVGRDIWIDMSYDDAFAFRLPGIKSADGTKMKVLIDSKGIGGPTVTQSMTAGMGAAAIGVGSSYVGAANLNVPKYISNSTTLLTNQQSQSQSQTGERRGSSFSFGPFSF